MNMGHVGRWALAAIHLFAAGVCLADVPIPQPQGRVTDMTGSVSPTADADLEARLADFAARTGNEVVVLMVASTAPEAIEGYSMRVAETWRPGQRDKDNGVLLLIAKDDRKLRIEVGYGLEGRLTDLAAKRIISTSLTPAFKRGDFAGGIAHGVDHIIQTIDGNELTGRTLDSGLLNNFLADFRADPLAGGLFLAIAAVLLIGMAVMYVFMVKTLIQVAKPSLLAGLVASAATLLAALAWGPGPTWAFFAMVATAVAFPFGMIVSLAWRQRNSMSVVVGGVVVTSRGNGGSLRRTSSSSFSSGGSFGGGGASGSW